MRRKILIAGILVIFGIQGLQAQVNVRDSAVQGFIFNFNLGVYAPGGDIAELYGTNMALGLDILYKTKSNWVLGVGANYFFSNDVKNQDELLGDLVTSGGNIIGVNGDYASLDFFERGYNIMAKVGKVFPVLNHNPNSGLFAQIGIGYIRHKTDIQNNAENVPYLLGDYAKGYDRLHGGLLLNEYIGLYHSGSRRTVNFTIGLDFQQGFTQNYREYNYHTRSYDTEPKLDLFFGLKASWFIPIYDKNAQKFYYN